MWIGQEESSLHFYCGLHTFDTNPMSRPQKSSIINTANCSIKASEMLVAPRISECFGLAWSALVCYGLPWSAIVCLSLLYSALVCYTLPCSAILCLGCCWLAAAGLAPAGLAPLQCRMGRKGRKGLLTLSFAPFGRSGRVTHASVIE